MTRTASETRPGFGYGLAVSSLSLVLMVVGQQVGVGSAPGFVFLALAMLVVGAVLAFAVPGWRSFGRGLATGGALGATFVVMVLAIIVAAWNGAS